MPKNFPPCDDPTKIEGWKAEKAVFDALKGLSGENYQMVVFAGLRITGEKEKTSIQQIFRESDMR